MDNRRHNRLFGALLAVMLTFGTILPVSAQLVIDITDGAERALPIAVVPFTLEENTPAPEDDIAEIIANNLRRSGKFEPVPDRDLIARPARMEDVRFQQWRALGIDNLVIGLIAANGDGTYRVRFELLDVYRGVRLEGSNFARVTPGAMRHLAHTISDMIYKAITGIDGAFNTEIAYITVEEEGPRRIHRLWVADADGARPHAFLASRQPLMSPTWSPDRSKLAYVSFEENERSTIWIMEIPSAERRKVAAYPGINSAPAWSPDGTRLALTLSRDGSPNIYVLELATGRLTQLTRTPAIDTEPVWSPDGRMIYFTSDRGGRPQIYRIPSSGGNAERVTFEGTYNARAAVSPDGKYLAMVHRDDSGFRIGLMNLQTRELRLLTDGGLDESPSFAPNGEMIIYSRVRGNRAQLATVSIHGSANMALPVTGNRVQEPSWSPR